MIFPTLSTERLVLRQTTADDVDSIYSMFSSAEVVEFYDTEAMKERSEAEEVIARHQKMFESKRGIRWGIALRDSGALIGTCGFSGKIDAYSSAHLGYDLARPHWGNGIMVEALRAVFAYGFDHYALNRIQATTNLDSVRSIATLNRMGFKEEGILRQYGFWKGQFHDVRCFSLLRSDWSACA